MAAVNFVTDFGAVGNGSTNNSPALVSFNTYYAGQTGLTTLTIPAGNYAFTDPVVWGRDGGDQLLILATGATLQNQSGFTLAGFSNNSDHDARIQTVSAGATTVTLVTGSETSKFTSGRWVVVAGIDILGYGEPFDPGIFEYKQIASIGSGTLTFTEALTRSYKSTWPSYYAGSTLHVNAGGPATVYQLDATWNQSMEIRGATFTDTGGQFYGRCKSNIITDCTFNTYGPIPSNCLYFEATRCNFRFAELDKVVERAVFQDCTIPGSGIHVQSSCINQLEMYNTNMTAGGWLLGVAGGNTIIDGLIAAKCSIGVLYYGAVWGNTTIRNATIASTDDLEYWFPGNNFALTNYTEEGGGVLSIVDGDLPVTWAIPRPDIWYALIDSGAHWALSFQVTDLTRSAGRTYIYTTLPYPVPSTSNGRSAPWSIVSHPSSHLTASGSVNNVLTTASSKPADSPVTILGIEWQRPGRRVSPLRMRLHA